MGKMLSTVSRFKKKKIMTSNEKDIKQYIEDKKQLIDEGTKLEKRRQDLEVCGYTVLNTLLKRINKLEDEKRGVFDFVISKEELDNIRFLIETAKSIPEGKLEKIANIFMNESEIENLEEKIETIEKTKKAVDELNKGNISIYNPKSDEIKMVGEIIKSIKEKGKDIPEKDVLERVGLIMDIALLFSGETLTPPQMNGDIALDEVLKKVFSKVRETHKKSKSASVESLYWKGIASLKKKEYNEAKECFEEITTTNPNLKGAWLNRGVASGELGDIRNEMAYYRLALRIDENYEKARRNMRIAERKKRTR
jgi:tetratricopeptide (TPR) repeat protein